MDLPECFASSADIGSPVKIISMARDFPTARARRWVPPAPKVNKKKGKKKNKKDINNHMYNNTWSLFSYCTLKTQTLSEENHLSH